MALLIIDSGTFSRCGSFVVLVSALRRACGFCWGVARQHRYFFGVCAFDLLFREICKPLLMFTAAAVIIQVVDSSRWWFSLGMVSPTGKICLAQLLVIRRPSHGGQTIHGS